MIFWIIFAIISLISGVTIILGQDEKLPENNGSSEIPPGNYSVGGSYNQMSQSLDPNVTLTYSCCVEGVLQANTPESRIIQVGGSQVTVPYGTLLARDTVTTRIPILVTFPAGTTSRVELKFDPWRPYINTAFAYIQGNTNWWDIQPQDTSKIFWVSLGTTSWNPNRQAEGTWIHYHLNGSTTPSRSIYFFKW